MHQFNYLKNHVDTNCCINYYTFRLLACMESADGTSDNMQYCSQMHPFSVHPTPRRDPYGIVGG